MGQDGASPLLTHVFLTVNNAVLTSRSAHVRFARARCRGAGRSLYRRVAPGNGRVTAEELSRVK